MAPPCNTPGMQETLHSLARPGRVLTVNPVERVHPPTRAHRRGRPASPNRNLDMAGYSAHLDLPPVMASVPLARHVTLDVLRSWGSAHDLADAALLVSELVSNVVDHAQAEAVLTLELALSGDWLRISVADGSAVAPVVRELRHDRPRGRGLQLVEGIADRWGVEDHHGGKRIWFELTPSVW